MTSRQFFEWQAYFELEPFGSIRQDLHAARALQMAHNLAVTKEHVKTDLNYFILKIGEPQTGFKRSQTPEMQVRMARMIAAAYATKQKVKDV